jgi:uncharacterized membrane protein
MTPSFPSSIRLVIAATLAAAVALSPAPTAVRTAFGVPLVLLLPGAALTSALFPARTPWVERLAASLGLSVAACVVTGFILHWTPFGLRAESWALALVGITGVGEAIAARRRPAGEGPTLGRLGRPQLPWRPTLLVGVALALTIGAVVLARTPLPAEGVQGYTALSLLPGGKGSDGVRVEVASSELEDTDYRLEVRSGEKLLAVRDMTLGTDEEWHAELGLDSIPTSRRTLEALLFRGEDKRAYRRATLTLPGSTIPPRTAIWLNWVDARTVRVQAASAEPDPTDFRLELHAGGRLERAADVTLEPGEQWQGIVDISSVPAEQRSFLEALLYRRDESGPQRAYRRATLVPPDSGLLETFGESK